MEKTFDSRSQDSGYTSTDTGSQWSAREDCLNSEKERSSPVSHSISSSCEKISIPLQEQSSHEPEPEPTLTPQTEEERSREEEAGDSSSSQKSGSKSQTQNSSQESDKTKQNRMLEMQKALAFNPEDRAYEIEGYARIRKERQQREEEYQRRKEEERVKQQNEFHSAMSTLLASRKTKTKTTEDSESNPDDTYDTWGDEEYAGLRDECQEREEEYQRGKKDRRWSQPNEFHVTIRVLLAAIKIKSDKKPIKFKAAPKGYAAQYNKTMQEQDKRFWESVSQKRAKGQAQQQQQQQRQKEIRKLGNWTRSLSTEILSSF